MSPSKEVTVRAIGGLGGRFLTPRMHSSGCSIKSLTKGSVHGGRRPKDGRIARTRRMQIATAAGIAVMAGRKHLSNRASTGSYPIDRDQFHCRYSLDEGRTLYPNSVAGRLPIQMLGKRLVSCEQPLVPLMPLVTLLLHDARLIRHGENI
jgi:hypothetical protein